MTADEYAAKKERQKAVEALIASDGWSIFLEGLQTERNRHLADALNLKLTHPERDGAAGACEALSRVADFIPQLAKSLASSLGGERKRRSSLNP